MGQFRRELGPPAETDSDTFTKGPAEMFMTPLGESVPQPGEDSCEIRKFRKSKKSTKPKQNKAPRKRKQKLIALC